LPGGPQTDLVAVQHAQDEVAVFQGYDELVGLRRCPAFVRFIETGADGEG